MRQPHTSPLHQILRDKRLYISVAGLAAVLFIIFNVEPSSIYIILAVVMLAAVPAYIAMSLFLRKNLNLALTILVWGTVFLHMGGILDFLNIIIVSALSIVLFIYFSR